MSSITFYRGNGSCSFVAHALFRELDIPFNTFLMKFLPEGWEAADGTLSREEYRRTVHPLGYIPCLVVDDQIITETPAVLTYIALFRPERNLLGSTQLERTRVAEWHTWLSGRMHGYGWGMLLRPARFTDDEAEYEAVKEKGRVIIAASFDRLEKHLEGRRFMVGEAETTVDFNIIIFWYWGRNWGFNMVEDYPNYTKQVRRMEEKPSIKAAAQEEKIVLSTE